MKHKSSSAMSVPLTFQSLHVADFAQGKGSYKSGLGLTPNRPAAGSTTAPVECGASLDASCSPGRGSQGDRMSVLSDGSRRAKNGKASNTHAAPAAVESVVKAAVASPGCMSGLLKPCMKPHDTLPSGSHIKRRPRSMARPWGGGTGAKRHPTRSVAPAALARSASSPDEKEDERERGAPDTIPSLHLSERKKTCSGGTYTTPNHRAGGAATISANDHATHLTNRPRSKVVAGSTNRSENGRDRACASMHPGRGSGGSEAVDTDEAPRATRRARALSRHGDHSPAPMRAGRRAIRVVSVSTALGSNYIVGTNNNNNNTPLVKSTTTINAAASRHTGKKTRPHGSGNMTLTGGSNSGTSQHSSSNNTTAAAAALAIHSTTPPRHGTRGARTSCESVVHQQQQRQDSSAGDGVETSRSSTCRRLQSLEKTLTHTSTSAALAETEDVKKQAADRRRGGSEREASRGGVSEDGEMVVVVRKSLLAMLEKQSTRVREEATGSVDASRTLGTRVASNHIHHHHHHHTSAEESGDAVCAQTSPSVMRAPSATRHTVTAELRALSHAQPDTRFAEERVSTTTITTTTAAPSATQQANRLASQPPPLLTRAAPSKPTACHRLTEPCPQSPHSAVQDDLSCAVLRRYVHLCTQVGEVPHTDWVKALSASGHIGAAVNDSGSHVESSGDGVLRSSLAATTAQERISRNDSANEVSTSRAVTAAAAAANVRQHDWTAPMMVSRSHVVPCTSGSEWTNTFTLAHTVSAYCDQHLQPYENKMLLLQRRRRSVRDALQSLLAVRHVLGRAHSDNDMVSHDKKNMQATTTAADSASKHTSQESVQKEVDKNAVVEEDRHEAGVAGEVRSEAQQRTLADALTQRLTHLQSAVAQLLLTMADCHRELRKPLGWVSGARVPALNLSSLTPSAGNGSGGSSDAKSLPSRIHTEAARTEGAGAESSEAEAEAEAKGRLLCSTAKEGAVGNVTAFGGALCPAGYERFMCESECGVVAELQEMRATVRQLLVQELRVMVSDESVFATPLFVPMAHGLTDSSAANSPQTQTQTQVQTPHVTPQATCMKVPLPNMHDSRGSAAAVVPPPRRYFSRVTTPRQDTAAAGQTRAPQTNKPHRRGSSRAGGVRRVHSSSRSASQASSLRTSHAQAAAAAPLPSQSSSSSQPAMPHALPRHDRTPRTTGHSSAAATPRPRPDSPTRIAGHPSTLTSSSLATSQPATEPMRPIISGTRRCSGESIGPLAPALHDEEEEAQGGAEVTCFVVRRVRKEMVVRDEWAIDTSPHTRLSGHSETKAVETTREDRQVNPSPSNKVCPTFAETAIVLVCGRSHAPVQTQGHNEAQEKGSAMQQQQQQQQQPSSSSLSSLCADAERAALLHHQQHHPPHTPVTAALVVSPCAAWSQRTATERVPHTGRRRCASLGASRRPPAAHTPHVRASSSSSSAHTRTAGTTAGHVLTMPPPPNRHTRAQTLCHPCLPHTTTNSTTNNNVSTCAIVGAPSEKGIEAKAESKALGQSSQTTGPPIRPLSSHIMTAAPFVLDDEEDKEKERLCEDTLTGKSRSVYWPHPWAEAQAVWEAMMCLSKERVSNVVQQTMSVPHKEGQGAAAATSSSPSHLWGDTVTGGDRGSDEAGAWDQHASLSSLLHAPPPERRAAAPERRTILYAVEPDTTTSTAATATAATIQSRSSWWTAGHAAPERGIDGDPTGSVTANTAAEWEASLLAHTTNNTAGEQQENEEQGKDNHTAKQSMSLCGGAYESLSRRVVRTPTQSAAHASSPSAPRETDTDTGNTDKSILAKDNEAEAAAAAARVIQRGWRCGCARVRRRRRAVAATAAVRVEAARQRRLVARDCIARFVEAAVVRRRERKKQQRHHQQSRLAESNTDVEKGAPGGMAVHPAEVAGRSELLEKIRTSPLPLRDHGITTRDIAHYNSDAHRFVVIALNRVLNTATPLLYLVRVLINHYPLRPPMAYVTWNNDSSSNNTHGKGKRYGATKYDATVLPTTANKKRALSTSARPAATGAEKRHTEERVRCGTTAEEPTTESATPNQISNEAAAKEEQEEDNYNVVARALQPWAVCVRRDYAAHGTAQGRVWCSDVVYLPYGLWQQREQVVMWTRRNEAGVEVGEAPSRHEPRVKTATKTMTRSCEPRSPTVIYRPLERWAHAQHLTRRVFCAAAIYAWKLIFSHTPHDDYKQRQLDTPEARRARLERVNQRNRMILACYGVHTEREWMREACSDLSFTGQLVDPRPALDPDDPDAEKYSREALDFVEDFLFQCFPMISSLEDVPSFLVGAGVHFVLKEVLQHVLPLDEGATLWSSRYRHLHVHLPAAYGRTWTGVQQRVLRRYEMILSLCGLVEWTDGAATGVSSQSRPRHSAESTAVPSAEREDTAAATARTANGPEKSVARERWPWATPAGVALMRVPRAVLSRRRAPGSPSPLEQLRAARFIREREECALRTLTEWWASVESAAATKEGVDDASEPQDDWCEEDELCVVYQRGFLETLSERLTRRLFGLRIDLAVCGDLDYVQ